MYLSVSIGNTDNKLSQYEWHEFVDEVNDAIKREGKIHFFGGASNWEPWQNVAWIIEVDNNWDVLKKYLIDIREKYQQDSVFVLAGKGNFI